MENPLIDQSVEKAVSPLLRQIEHYGQSPCELLNPYDNVVVGELLHLMTTLNSMKQYEEIRTELHTMVIKCHEDSRADNIKRFCDGVASMMYPTQREIKAAKINFEKEFAIALFAINVYEKDNEEVLSLAKEVYGMNFSETDLDSKLNDCIITHTKEYLKRCIYGNKSRARGNGFYDDDLDEVGYYPGLKALKPKIELIQALRDKLQKNNKDHVFLVIEEQEEQQGREEWTRPENFAETQNIYKVEDVLAMLALTDRRF